MIKYYAFALLILIAVTSCGKSYNTRGLDHEQLEQLADAAFLDEDFNNAAGMYTELMFGYPGAANTDLYLYRLGMSEAALRFWADALFYFNRVQSEYSRSSLADDCSFQSARIWWLQRHNYKKDLTPIMNSRTQLISFFEKYPGSTLIEEATALSDSINNVLSMRALFVGQFYARRNKYDASLLYLREALNDYGDTECKAEILMAIGGVYIKRGNEYSARRFFQRALDECELNEDQLIELQNILEEL
ncbi:MAG: outer membrane protein assembly factor BamD [Candidatus Aegiribacteria sp.]|nr:outer membrane protein assembly factor BamD [Candidatus Aegiribacteria sp.]